MAVLRQKHVKNKGSCEEQIIVILKPKVPLLLFLHFKYNVNNFLLLALILLFSSTQSGVECTGNVNTDIVSSNCLHSCC